MLPRVVMRGKLRAALDRRMVITPEDDKRIWIWIVQRSFAQRIECTHSGPLRIGNQSVNRLLSIDIGLVFEVAADGAFHRLGDKLQYR